MDGYDNRDDEQVDESSGFSRRSALRRGAVLGGSLVWTVPAVQSVSRVALAQTNGTPPPSADDCCTADAFGLRVRIDALTINQTLGTDGCVAEVDAAVIGNPTSAEVTAKAICGTASSPAGGPCTGDASIAELDIVVLDAPLLPPQFALSATVLTSQATAECDPCDVAGSSSILSLSVSSNGLSHTINVNDLVGNCNVNVLALVGLGSLGEVTFNRQSCSGDTLMVDALYVNVLGEVEVVAARSMAQADNCGCSPC